MKLKKYRGWVVSILVIVVIIGVAVRSTREPEGVVKFSNMGNKHLSALDEKHEPYNSNPPTSGPHVNNKAPWGVSKEILPKELQINNLEDGGVIIQYNPEKVTPEEITLLEKIVNQKRESIIVAPYYDMEYKIALTAWNRLLPLENVEEKQIDVFIGRYAGKDHHVRNPNL